MLSTQQSQEATGIPGRRYVFDILTGVSSLPASNQLKAWIFPQAIPSNWTVRRAGVEISYKISTVTSGVTSIRWTETVRNQFIDCFVANMQVQTPALGLLDNNLASSALRRIQMQLGLIPMFDLAPGLSQAIPTNGTSQHTGFLEISYAADLPHDWIKDIFCAAGRQWQGGQIILNSGSFTFTDSAGVVWTVDRDNTVFRYFVDYVERATLIEAHPLVYEYITTSDFLANLNPGLYGSLSLLPAASDKTPRAYGLDVADGFDLRFDGCQKRDPNNDGVPVRLADFASRDAGYENPYTREYPYAFGRMDMLAIPLLSLRRDGFHAASICGGDSVTVKVQQGNGYSTPYTYEIARVPFSMPECVCAHGKTMWIPGISRDVALPPSLMRVLPTLDV